MSRAVLANLVVLCHRPGEAPLDLQAPLDIPIDEIACRHPSRVIVIHHNPTPARCSPVDAAVAITTFGAGPSRFGVEQIVIRSACADASLPSIVRRLALGGVPTSIWRTDDVARTGGVASLMTMARQLVYDSRMWSDFRRGLTALRPVLETAHAPHIADVSWQRISAARTAIAHAVESNDLNRDELRTGSVRYRRGDAASAWLLAGWMATASEPDGGGLDVEEDDRQSEMMIVTTGRLRVTVTEHAATATIEEGGRPFTVPSPPRSEAEAIAVALQSFDRATALRGAIDALLRRFATAR